MEAAEAKALEVKVVKADADSRMVAIKADVPNRASKMAASRRMEVTVADEVVAVVEVAVVDVVEVDRTRHKPPFAGPFLDGTCHDTEVERCINIE